MKDFSGFWTLRAEHAKIHRHYGHLKTRLVLVQPVQCLNLIAPADDEKEVILQPEDNGVIHHFARLMQKAGIDGFTRFYSPQVIDQYFLKIVKGIRTADGNDILKGIINEAGALPYHAVLLFYRRVY